MTMSRSHYQVLRSDCRKVHPEKSKIGRMAAILDRTKILFDVHQRLMIGHDCAQYE